MKKAEQRAKLEPRW